MICSYAALPCFFPMDGYPDVQLYSWWELNAGLNVQLFTDCNEAITAEMEERLCESITSNTDSTSSNLTLSRKISICYWTDLLTSGVGIGEGIPKPWRILGRWRNSLVTEYHGFSTSCARLAESFRKSRYPFTSRLNYMGRDPATRRVQTSRCFLPLWTQVQELVVGHDVCCIEQHQHDSVRLRLPRALLLLPDVKCQNSRVTSLSGSIEAFSSSPNSLNPHAINAFSTPNISIPKSSWDCVTDSRFMAELMHVEAYPTVTTPASPPKLRVLSICVSRDPQA